MSFAQQQQQQQQQQPAATWPLHVDFRGARVIELGSGCGLCGLAAARLGASRVVMTDIDEVAENCTAFNCANGGLRHSTNNPSPALESEKYNKGGGTDGVLSSSSDGICVAGVLDWTRETIPEFAAGSFDYILAADVMYNSCFYADFVRTLKFFLLSSSAGSSVAPPLQSGPSPQRRKPAVTRPVAIVGYKVRHEAEAEFFALLSNAGCQHEVVHRWTAGEGPEHDLQVLAITLR
jgi:predicted nicotinamide N-methyase